MISIPKSLIHIGEACFCNSQIYGTINGSNLEFIGRGCFAQTHITGFVFSFKVSIIPDYLFYCSDLSGDVVLPETIKEIGVWAFAFTQITKINIPLSLESVKDAAFLSCSKLVIYATTIIIKNIGIMTFCDCRSLAERITIEADVIGKSAFQGCSNIVTMEICTKSSIENQTFEYCSALKSIKINSDKNAVKFIGKEAFAYCKSLEEIILPEGIQEIKSKAFYMCSSYSGKLNLTIYPNLTKIGDEAYFGCKELFGEISFPDSLDTICNGAFTGCRITGSLVIPNSVKTIGPYAFFKCTELSGIISIGDGVSEIGDSAFALCSNIAGNIIFGQNVSIIHKRAFFGCSSITGNIILPPKIERINDAAFYSCATLKGELILPNTLRYIGDSAFAECKGLTGRLRIPKSVESIGKNAFFNCRGFEDVYFDNTSTSVGYFAFSNMHIKCFKDAPKNVRKNHPEIYSSDNFKGMMLPKNWLNQNCPAFYAIDGIFVGFTTIASTGILTTVALFAFNWFANKKTNVSKYKEVFKEIIEKARLEEEINDDEIAERIVNKINERLSYESNNDAFTTTKGQAIAALNKSIEESWPTICIQQQQNILEKSLNDINFKDPCSKCKCCSKRRNDVLTIDESSEGVVMTTLL